MPDNFRDNPQYLKLYEIPIEQLDLSEHIVQILQKQGLTTVADCIDCFVVARNSLISTPFEFARIMETEVQEKLRLSGYWAFYERAISDT